jgi:hypothetical protein
MYVTLCLVNMGLMAHGAGHNPSSHESQDERDRSSLKAPSGAFSRPKELA